MLAPNQRTFVRRLSALSGLSPRVIAAWALSEESAGAAQGYQRRNYNNWLNIAAFDNGFGATYRNRRLWNSPERGAQMTFDFLRGKRFGASGGIRAILGSRRGSAGQQIAAIARSGWASSGYNGGSTLRQLYNQVGGTDRPPGLAETRPPRMRPARARRPSAGSIQVSGGTAPDMGLVSQLASQLSAAREPVRPAPAAPPLPAFSSRLAGVGLPEVPSVAPPPSQAQGLSDSLAALSSMAQPATPNVKVKLPGTGPLPRVRGHGGLPQAVGASRALDWARGRIGVTETNGSNTGGRRGLIDAWQRNFGTHGVAWCGIFVGNALRQAGVRGIGNDWSYTGSIAAHGRARNGGALGTVSRRNLRPGDVAVWRPGPAGHTGIVERVNRDGSYVTIEGNSSNRVQRVLHRDAAVFVRPDYPGRR